MKLFAVSSIFLLVLLENQLCMTFEVDPLSISRNVLTLARFIKIMIDNFGPKEVVPGDGAEFRLQKKLDEEVIGRLKFISSSLEDIPDVLDYRQQKSALSKLFNDVNSIFIEAVVERSYLTEPITDELQKSVWRLNFGKLHHDFREILRVLTGGSAAPWLDRTYTTNVKKFETICNTGVSQIQFLSVILNQMKVMAAEYLIAKNYTYDIIDGIGNKQAERMKLQVKTEDSFRGAVKVFKRYMASASRDIYLCGDADQVRPDHELKIVSTYFIFGNVVNWYRSIVYDNERGYCKKVWENQEKISKYTLGCTDSCAGYYKTTVNYQLHGKAREASLVCVNPNFSQDTRYYSIAEKEDQITKFHCNEPGFVVETKKGGISLCKYTNCAIDLEPFRADHDKVIVGAQLVLEKLPVNNGSDFKKILGLRYEQAELLADGIINETSRTWSSSDRIGRGKTGYIGIDGTDKFLLDKFVIDDWKVLVGLQFAIRDEKYIMITGEYRDFNFERGNFFGSGGRIEPIRQTLVKHDVGNDSPYNRKDKRNNIISEDGSFVQLKITSLEEDGGQHTVPFIDTQQVIPKIITPLSGAGLYVKSSPGSGGYLGLKLVAYNITSFISDVYV